MRISWFLLNLWCLVACQIVYPADALSLRSTMSMRGQPLLLESQGLPKDVTPTYQILDSGTAQCRLADPMHVIADFAGNCVVEVSYATTDQQRIYAAEFILTFKQAQAPLRIALTQGVVGTPLGLAVVGGNGTGAVEYTLLAASDAAVDCQMNRQQLTVASSGTCTVIATKYADDRYIAQTTAATQVEFVLPPEEDIPSPTPIPQTATSDESSNASGGFALPETATATAEIIAPATPTAIAWQLVTLNGTVRQPLELRISDATRAVTYQVQPGASGCVLLSPTQLLAERAGTCVVTMMSDAEVQTASVDIALALAPPLVVSPDTGARLPGVALSVSGSVGTGALSFVVADGSATSCTVVNGVLTADVAGSCVVTAMQAADEQFAATMSEPTTVLLEDIVLEPLIVTASDGVFGSPIELFVSGLVDDGTEVVVVVTGGTARGCRVSSFAVLSESAGSCDVMVSQGQRTSNVATAVFARAPQAALNVKGTLSGDDTALSLRISGGSGTGKISLSVKDGSAIGCRLNGSTLSAKYGGTCTVTVVKDGDENYLPTKLSKSLSVGSGSG